MKGKCHEKKEVIAGSSKASQKVGKHHRKWESVTGSGKVSPEVEKVTGSNK